jgi:hypothetical protein
VPVERYSVGEFEAIFKFLADSGLWGANVRCVCVTCVWGGGVEVWGCVSGCVCGWVYVEAGVLLCV